jgi:hypothetical protein
MLLAAPRWCKKSDGGVCMHMMFVDESGDEGYPEDGVWSGWGGSTLFVRVGAIIHGGRWRALNERLKDFKRNKGLTWDAEIKAVHIRRGKGAFAGLDGPMRNLLLHDLLDLIGGDQYLTLLGVVIDKTKVDLKKRDRLVKPEIRSMELLLERYNLFLRHQTEKSGIVVLDPTQELSDDNIRYFQLYLQAHSQNLRPVHIVEGTFFAKSHTSNMVQISDICTNVLYRNETGRRGADAEFRKVWPRFWRRNSRVQGYGIKRWP